jgi:hypothetical protein
MTIIWNLSYISTSFHKINTALQQEKLDENASFHGVRFMTPRRKTYKLKTSERGYTEVLRSSKILSYNLMSSFKRPSNYMGLLGPA